MAARKKGDLARFALDKNRRDARDMVEGAGRRETEKLLRRAQRDLEARLKDAVARGNGETFTVMQLRGALLQVRLVLAKLLPAMQQNVLSLGATASDRAAGAVADYLRAAEREFKGSGAQPLALREASMLSAAQRGARASILRRLALSGTSEGADRDEHPAKLGVLQRYGVDTVNRFEKTLQTGMVAKKSWIEMRADITRDSPFLQQQPAFWAHRIVRTEVMGALNRGSLESMKQGHKQLGDLVKIVSENFDDRTGADSYAVHGQIRRLDEPFESWFGPYDHPPNRPNDRATTTPHRESWPIPDYLAWKSDEAVQERWEQEGRKGECPDRPEMSTVDGMGDFGDE